MKKKLLSTVVILLLLLGLSACGGGKADMPMEVTVDGYTIILGETTVKDMTELGYVAKLTKKPTTVKEGEKYIPFSFSLERGRGDQVHVTVMAPYHGGKTITKETNFAATEGVIRTVQVTLNTTKDVDVLYNGVDIKDITFESGVSDWGAKEEGNDSSSKLRYTVEAKDGTVTLLSSSTTGEEFNSLMVSQSMKKFLKLQKD